MSRQRAPVPMLLPMFVLLALAPAAAASAGALTDAPFAEFLGTGYLAPFVVLLLCGFGLPIPEEITMLGAGFLAHRGDVQFVPVVLVCLVATLLGDSIPYFVGRRWGRQALRSRTVRRALHPERLRSIERRFERHGLWAIFVCRFLPGVRLPAWFTAGSLGVPYHRFILVDGIAACLMTPAFVALGRYSGERLTQLEGRVEGLTQILGFVALALALTFVIHLGVRHKPRRGLGGGRAAPSAPTPSPAPAQSAPSELPPQDRKGSGGGPLEAPDEASASTSEGPLDRPRGDPRGDRHQGPSGPSPR